MKPEMFFKSRRRFRRFPEWPVSQPDLAGFPNIVHLITRKFEIFIEKIVFIYNTPEVKNVSSFRAKQHHPIPDRMIVIHITSH